MPAWARMLRSIGKPVVLARGSAAVLDAHRHLRGRR